MKTFIAISIAANLAALTSVAVGAEPKPAPTPRSIDSAEDISSY
jgi:hypothetical protein